MQGQTELSGNKEKWVWLVLGVSWRDGSESGWGSSMGNSKARKIGSRYPERVLFLLCGLCTYQISMSSDLCLS